MSDTFLWPDSEVWRIEAPPGASGVVLVHLSAAAVERIAPGATGPMPLTGFLKPLTLAFQHATVTGPLQECMGSVVKGEWRLHQEAARPPCEPLKLPLQIDTPLSLSLHFRNGSNLLIEAASARSLTADQARFIESYAC